MLVEHVDATGAAAHDARVRSAALRERGLSVETFVLDARFRDDLLYGEPERTGRAGIESFGADAAGLEALRRRVAASRAQAVLWASASPGGGAAARVLPGDRPAWWWPTGHAPASAARGPLETLDLGLPPCAGSCVEKVKSPRGRLSLWDGPFVLVPFMPSGHAARALIDAFAAAVEERDDADLVVLDHGEPEFDALARDAGVDMRVHAVGPAPREAEAAWLSTAALALVSGDRALSGGWLLRALGSGCPVRTVGEQAAPIERWLAASGAGWGPSFAADRPDLAVGAALDRDPRVSAAREAGRELAAEHDPERMAAAVDAAWRCRAVAARAA